MDMIEPEKPDHRACAPAMAPSRPRAGVYVHFPWCLAKCPYCDFVSYVAPNIDHAGYADAVLREIDARADLVEGRRVESIFFGGGTPSLWKARDLGRVLSGVRQRVGLSATSGDLEITVECNPTSLDEDGARALIDVGVNRLSIGVQSLRDQRLRFLGRLHDARGAAAAVRGAIQAGVPRVSADLIFGLPGQSPGDARDEALELADLGVAHLSCYQLTIEAGTRFGELARRGRLPLADDGHVAGAFLAIDAALTARGFRHYEISNYARPGEEARHNLGYWRGDEYLGLGCGSYGFVRARSPDGDAGGATRPADQAGRAARPRSPSGVRWRNAVRPERYVEATRSMKRSAVGAGDGLSDSSEELDAQTLLRERIMLGLRIDHGMDLGAAANELDTAGFTLERERAVEWLASRGRIVRDGSTLRIPPASWLWTDDTAARLF
jgi:putative oxygen-independent coproporphyrinogen III oxidase